jgi:hypothetical protein
MHCCDETLHNVIFPIHVYEFCMKHFCFGFAALLCLQIINLGNVSRDRKNCRSVSYLKPAVQTQDEGHGARTRMIFTFILDTVWTWNLTGWQTGSGIPVDENYHKLLCVGEVPIKMIIWVSKLQRCFSTSMNAWSTIICQSVEAWNSYWFTRVTLQY